jgi:hypothetical protein
MRLVGILVLVVALGAAPERAGNTGRQLEFTVKPAAAGRQLVRLSVPVPPGMLPEGHGVAVWDGHQKIKAAVRVLTWHPGADASNRFARRALITFPYTFADRDPVSFLAEERPGAAAGEVSLPVEVTVGESAVTIAYRGGPILTARLLAPARMSSVAPATEIVEANPFFLWKLCVAKVIDVRTTVPEQLL